MPEESSSAGPPARRTRRALGTLASLGGLAAVLAVLLTSDRVGLWAANAVLGRIHPGPGARIAAAGFRGDWIRGFDLLDVRIERADSVLAQSDTLRVRYSLPGLAGRTLDIAAITVSNASVDLGALVPQRAEPAPPDTATPRGPSRGVWRWHPIQVGELTLSDCRIARGRFVADRWVPASAEHIVLDARGIRLRREGIACAVDRIGAVLASEAAGSLPCSLDASGALGGGRLRLDRIRIATGRTAVTARGDVPVGFAGPPDDAAAGRTSIALRASPAVLADLAPYVPALSAEGEAEIDVALEGPRADRLSGSAALRVRGARPFGRRIESAHLDARFTDGRADVALAADIDGVGLEVDGWVRPLGGDAGEAGYELAGRVTSLPDRVAGAAWWRGVRGPEGSEMRFEVAGRGFSLDEAAARARVALIAPGGGAANDATPPRGEATVTLAARRLDAGVAWADEEGGSFRAIGHLVLVDTLSYAVESAEFDDLDLSRIGLTTSPARLSGVVTLRGRGFSGEGRRLDADVALRESSWGAARLDSASLRAHLAGNRLALSGDGSVDGAALRVDTLIAALGPEPAIDQARIRFSRLDLSDLTGSAALACSLTGDATLRGRLHARRADGTTAPIADALRGARGIEASGRLRLDGSRWGGAAVDGADVRFEISRGTIALDGGLAALGPAAEGTATATRLNATFSGRAAGFGSDSLRADFRASLDSSLVQSLRIRRGDIEGTLDRGALRLEAVVDVDSASATIAASGEPFARPRRFEARGEVRATGLAPLAARPDLRIHGAATFAAHASGSSLAELTGEATLAAAGRVGRVDVDTVAATLSVAGGVLSLDTLEVRSSAADARGSGRIAVGAAADSAGASGAPGASVHLAATLKDLAPAAELAGLDTLAVESGEAVVTLSGSLRDLAWDASGNLVGAAVGPARALRLGARTNGRSSRAGAPRRLLATVEAAGAAYGGFVADSVSATVEISGKTTDVSAVAAAGNGQGVSVRARILSEPDSLTVQIDSLALAAPRGAWRLDEPASLLFAKGRFSVERLSIRSGNGGLEVHGTIDRRGTQDFHARLDSLYLDGLAAFKGRRGLGGRASARLDVTGDAAAAMADGRLDMTIESDGRAVARLAAALSADPLRSDLEARFVAPGGESLAVDGTLPVVLALAIPDTGAPGPILKSAAEAFDLRVRSSDFPLESLAPLLDPSTITLLRGRLDVDARIAAPRADSLGRGSVAVSGAAVRLPSLGVEYTDIEIAAALSGSRIDLTRASARSGDGSLSARGSLTLNGTSAPTYEVDLDLDRYAAISARDVKATLSGKMRVSGRGDSLTVRGTVEPSAVEYFVVASGGARDVVLTPEDYRMLEETFGPSVLRRRLTRSPGVFDKADIDLTARCERNLWVRMRRDPRLAAELSGTIRVVKAPGDSLRLEGTLEPVRGRGFVEQLGRRFDITGGEVVLNGDPMATDLNVKTEYKVTPWDDTGRGEIVVSMDVRGTLDKMNLSFTSDPALEQSEILSLIATGSTGQSSSQATSTERRDQAAGTAAQIGMTGMTGAVEELAEESIGLDVVQIRQDGLRGATLVAGTYVSPPLYLGFRQPVFFDSGKNDNDEDEETIEFELEYAMSRWLAINLQGGGSNFKGFFRGKLGY
jgi:translocation and assembly module TamB